MGKRGPKKAAGKREINGRLSRDPEDRKAREIAAIDAEAWDAMHVAVMARVRVHGVPLERAKGQNAGSFVGRLRDEQQLSDAQLDAAQTYLVERAAYRRAISAPPDIDAVDLNRVKGRASAENGERSQRDRARYEATLKAVQDAQNALHGTATLFAALDFCLVRDMPLRHLVGDLRLALNALAKHYGLIGAKAA